MTILASAQGTGHALGADLAIVDEAGLLQESQRDLWAAVMSSVSGRDGRLLAISIQGDGPMFWELGERADDDSVVWEKYAAPDDAALDDEEAWALANPGLADGIKSLVLHAGCFTQGDHHSGRCQQLQGIRFKSAAFTHHGNDLFSC